MSAVHNRILAQSSSPGFQPAVESERTKMKKKLDDTKMRVNTFIIGVSLLSYGKDRNIIMVIVNVCLVVVSMMVQDVFVMQTLTVMLAPITLMQKLAFSLAGIIDQLIIDKMKETDVLTYALKACKYAVLSVFFISTL